MPDSLAQKDIDTVNIPKKRILFAVVAALALIAAVGMLSCHVFYDSMFPDLDERDFVSDLCVRIKNDSTINKILSQENNRLGNVLWGYRRGRFEISVWTSTSVKDTRSVSERIKEIKAGIRDDVSTKMKTVVLEWGVGKEPYREQVYKTEILDFDR
jgi:hypothetical protein